MRGSFNFQVSHAAFSLASRQDTQCRELLWKGWSACREPTNLPPPHTQGFRERTASEGTPVCLKLPLNKFGSVVEQGLGKQKNLYIVLESFVETSNCR